MHPVTQRIWLQSLLLLSLGLLIWGVFSPLLQLRQFWFFSANTSLASAIQELFQHGEWLLGSIILLFSVVFPIGKNLLSIWALTLPTSQQARWLNRLALIGKWSMLDVFIVALVVVAAKLGLIIDATVQYGLYLLVAATLLSLVTGSLIAHRSTATR